MKVTYYGHSCFSVNVGGKNILFDPFITPNELAKHINVNEVPADYIFVSHAHFDHINDAVNIALRTNAKVVGNWEIHSWFNKGGISNTQPMNPGGKWGFEFGTVRCVPAHHSSSFPDGSYGGVASGFVFQTPEGSFYYTGDAALSLEMQLIKRFGKLDFLVAPIGDLLTMGADDVIELAKWLDVKEVLGVHYDTFGLIKIDHGKVTQQFEAAGLRLRLLPVGATENF